MNTMCRLIRRIMFYMGICWVGMVMLSGCAIYEHIGNLPGGAPSQGYGHAPTLSNLSVAPNPTSGGNIVNLTAKFVDPEADLEFGVAAVSINGEKFSRISFRSTYVSGLLTIPLAVSYYSRPSDLQISLMIRDSAGNWSNSVATALSIR